MPLRSLASLAALALLVPGCSALKDRPGFVTDTVTISKDPATGEIVISPEVIRGTWSYGGVQVNNKTGDTHGFAIDELAIYAEIPRLTAPIVAISDARDDTTYVFYCQVHDEPGQEGTEFRGELVIDYVEEEQL